MFFIAYKKKFAEKYGNIMMFLPYPGKGNGKIHQKTALQE